MSDMADAPRDGTEILAWTKDGHVVVYWHDDAWRDTVEMRVQKCLGWWALPKA